MMMPLDDSWATETGLVTGGTVRVRALPPQQRWIETAPDLIIVTWTCGLSDRLFHGGPGPVTAARMEAFEKRLTTLVEAQGLARLMMVTTAGLMRRWHFYATDAGRLTALIERAINEGSTGKLTVEAIMDPGWKRWQEMMTAASAASAAVAVPATEPICGFEIEQRARASDTGAVATRAVADAESTAPKSCPNGSGAKDKDGHVSSL